MVISQSPFLFDGTLRDNLDITGEFEDEQLWRALEKVSISEYISSLPDKLDTRISNSNIIFSTGEKQLFCMARALLSSNDGIVLLDEATSNLDKKTDEVIQKTIKESFPDRTVLTIAHRLNTVADYDKVAVLDGGIVTEFDHPYLLLSRDSVFKEMASVNPVLFEEIYEVAKKAYEMKNK